jgi:hypothetical protein
MQKVSFVVDKKQKFFVEPNKVEGESGDRSAGTLKANDYDIDKH